MKFKAALLMLLLPGLVFAAEPVRKKRKVVRPKTAIKQRASTPTRQDRVMKRPAKPITVDSISGPVEPSESISVRTAPATSTTPAPVPAIERRRPVRETRSSDHEFSLGMAMWQESIKLKSGGAQANMESQFKGVTIGYELHTPKENSPWYWLYGIEVGAGTIKGQGEAPISDQFDNQTWTMITARAGWIIKTTDVSRFGLAVPVAFRTVNWVYEPNSTTKAQEKKFSAGGSIIYEMHLTERGRLRAMVTRQHMWDAHLWSAAWSVEF